MSAFVIALLGAESTGKTTLAAALGQALSDDGKNTVVVNEYLREFCDRHGRTPTQAEQTHIAHEQTRRIDEMAQRFEIVIADTTALMTAVYSEQVFGDRDLYSTALQAHQRPDLTLLTALDITWEADGLQRNGPQVRQPVDTLIRTALLRASKPYSVVTGQGPARLQHALRCVEHALGTIGSTPNASSETHPTPGESRWRTWCDCCGDPACERLSLSGRNRRAFSG